MKYEIDKPIRLIELFAGVGSQAMALRDIGVDFEHYRVVEFDKYPVASYNAIHGTNFPTMDITKISGADLGIVDTDRYTYLLIYSFPCQDLSVAGKGKGMRKDSGTRSGLLWEVERLLNETEQLPQVLVMENVPQVHSKKNMPDFENWLNYLESRGYKTFWQDLNAMNYGIPQSRNRCIAVSILGDYEFIFPEIEPLTTVMADFLEPQVEDKYYLTSEKAKDLVDKLVFSGKIVPFLEQGGDGIILRNCGSSDEARTPDARQTDVAATLLSRDYKGLSNYGSNAAIECKRIGFHRDQKTMTTLTSNCGSSSTRKGKRLRKAYEAGEVHHGYNEHREAEPRLDGVCNTITTVQKDNFLLESRLANEIPEQFHKFIYEINGELYLIRIRKLTPLECWRLMGFTDEDYWKAASVNSNTQLYKQAGNSIVKQVLMKVFSQMIPTKNKVTALKQKALA